MREIGHFIGGKLAAGTSGKFGDVYNPAAGEVTAHVALASTAEVGWDPLESTCRHASLSIL